MIDLFLVIIFIVYSVAVGFWARRKTSRDLRNYFLAGRLAMPPQTSSWQG